MSDIKPVIEQLRAALEPFAAAAKAINLRDPSFPRGGAALRASFDWFAAGELGRRHCVTMADMDRAEEALDILDVLQARHVEVEDAVRREREGCAKTVDAERELRGAHYDAAIAGGAKKEARDFQTMVIAHSQAAAAIRSRDAAERSTQP